jgi:hypothetical protein
MLDSCWAVTGQLMELLASCWTITGQLLESSWTVTGVTGQLLGSCWTVNGVTGQLLDNYWTVTGEFWTITGVTGQLLASCWTDGGQLLANSEQTVAHMQLTSPRLFGARRKQMETTGCNVVSLGKQLPTSRKITLHSHAA